MQFIQSAFASYNIILLIGYSNKSDCVHIGWMRLYQTVLPVTRSRCSSKNVSRNFIMEQHYWIFYCSHLGLSLSFLIFVLVFFPLSLSLILFLFLQLILPPFSSSHSAPPFPIAQSLACFVFFAEFLRFSQLMYFRLNLLYQCDNKIGYLANESRDVPCEHESFL